MQRLGDILEAQQRVTAAEAGPDAGRLWTLAHLPPSTALREKRATVAQQMQRGRIAMQALDELGADCPVNAGIAKLAQEAGIKRLAAQLTAIDAELEQAAERDALQATRPEGCRCLGLGSFDGRVCICPEGIAFAAIREQERVEDEARMQAQLAADAERATVAAQARRLEDARIPKRFASFTFATFPRERAKAEAIARLEQFGVRGYDCRGVFLTGPFGVGKTGLAICALCAWLDQGRPGVFVAVPDLFAEMRATFDHQGGPRDPAQTAHGILQRVRKVPLLVLDDLGAERPTPWMREQLFRIVNGRHDEERPTIFTSNYSLNETAARLSRDDDAREGERIVWRIAEMCDVVELRGRNLRERQ